MKGPVNEILKQLVLRAVAARVASQAQGLDDEAFQAQLRARRRRMMNQPVAPVEPKGTLREGGPRG